MVPTAQAAPMDNPADAIDDLSLVSVSKYGNHSDRNSITLSWSAPNDNGSPILFYNIQVHEISGDGWTVLENDVYGTTYTHENAPTSYQFSYRVYAIAADGCNGSTSTFYNACNESNILHVVSLPNAESGTVNSSCNNSDLDDCGYFDTEKIDTCFNRSGYSIPGVVDVTDGGNEFVFSGKLSPMENGQCMIQNNAYFLPNKSVSIIAEKGTEIGAGNEQKIVNVITNPDNNSSDNFEATLTFTEASDVGPWKILYMFYGDDDYNPTSDGNTIGNFQITVTEAPNTFTITDDSTGGDCTSIGTWNNGAKICTLSTDLTKGIIIDSDQITLDGNGKSITGTYTSLNPSASTFTEGVKIDGATGVTVKNLVINNVNSGNLSILF